MQIQAIFSYFIFHQSIFKWLTNPTSQNSPMKTTLASLSLCLVRTLSPYIVLFIFGTTQNVFGFY